jgi:hypothetical protein
VENHCPATDGVMTGTLNKTNSTLIAPCGINCRLCQRYVSNKNACPACRGDDSIKSKTCAACRLKNCEKLIEGGFRYCFSCDEFPCALVSRLEKRYTANYDVSVLDNLEQIRKNGIRSFVRRENKKWICSKCGEMLCMHKVRCLSCGHIWREPQFEKERA